MQSDYLTTSNTKNVSWNILDLVVYTATDDTVLVFFHNTGKYQAQKQKMHNINSL